MLTAPIKSPRIDRAVFQQTLDKKLMDLPSLPAIVHQLMRVTDDPNATAEDIQRLIMMDPVLASKVLQLVNSAYYGFSKRISTISQAVLMMGFGTVRNLVIGVSAVGLLTHKSSAYGLNRAHFWRHCAATAAAASLLAKRRLPRQFAVAEEAFLGGLLHDVGSLFLDSHFAVQHAVALAFAKREGMSAQAAESYVLGIDHVMIGRRISERWNFPSHMTAMLGFHHDPNPQREHFDMVALIHASDWLAWECGHPSSEHPSAPVLYPAVEEWLHFEDGQWEMLKAELQEQYQECEQLIQIVQ